MIFLMNINLFRARLPRVTHLAVFFSMVCAAGLSGQDSVSDGDRMIAQYFAYRTSELERNCLAEVQTADQWRTAAPQYRRQLASMLGLDPMPERTPLQATVTKKFDYDGITVECLHFQSSPGLYVTANLYRPQEIDQALPAILYVCGHGGVKKDGVSYGNKTHYHHHGVWFARNGYVCLVIDTVQLGEIEGLHHGTYRYGMWWWNAIGYTPAGVEAWNGIRAIDYLCTREEVDADRIGITGRSGGGAYSWWVTALDERVQVAVPVAGITSTRNHVVDGCVEGHCDCMFPVNTFRWDYPAVAALVAPRPLLISNTDKDSIFPLDGVVDVHQRVRRIYRLLGAGKKLGLHITEGPHSDTQELRVHAFRWINRFLKNDDSLIDVVADEVFEAEQLKVLDQIPDDEINTTIHERFIQLNEPPAAPRTLELWQAQRKTWMSELLANCFRSWPATSAASATEIEKAESRDVLLRVLEVAAVRDSTTKRHSPIRTSVYFMTSPDVAIGDIARVHLRVIDESEWAEAHKTLATGFAGDVRGIGKAEAPDVVAFNAIRDELAESPQTAIAWFAARGIGPTAWTSDKRERVHIRRRFNLLGETLDSMRVWDTRLAIAAIRDFAGNAPLHVSGAEAAGAIAMYATFFEDPPKSLHLENPPTTHHDGPIFLNVLKVLDMPQAVAMACERCPVTITTKTPSAWNYSETVGKLTGGDFKVVIGSALSATSE